MDTYGSEQRMASAASMENGLQPLEFNKVYHQCWLIEFTRIIIIAYGSAPGRELLN